MAKKSRQQKDEERRKEDEDKRADQGYESMTTKKHLPLFLVAMLMVGIPTFGLIILIILGTGQRIQYANIYGYSRLDWLAGAIWTLFLVAVTYALLQKTKKIERGEHSWKKSRNWNLLIPLVIGAASSLIVGLFVDVANNWVVLGVEKRQFSLEGCKTSHSYRGSSSTFCDLADSLGGTHRVDIISERDNYFYGPTACFELNLNIGLFGGRFADKKVRPKFLPDSACPEKVYVGGFSNSWYSN